MLILARSHALKPRLTAGLSRRDRITHVTRAIISGHRQTTAIFNAASAAGGYLRRRTSTTIRAFLMFRNGSKDHGRPRQLYRARIAISVRTTVENIARAQCARNEYLSRIEQPRYCSIRCDGHSAICVIVRNLFYATQGSIFPCNICMYCYTTRRVTPNVI